MIVYLIVLKTSLINRTDRVIKTSNVQTRVSCFKNLNPDQVAIHPSPNHAHVCACGSFLGCCVIINYAFSSQYMYPVIGSAVSLKFKGLSRYLYLGSSWLYRRRLSDRATTFSSARGTLVTGLACFSHSSTCATRVSACVCSKMAFETAS